MNLLSKESRYLDDSELALLNTISELVGTAIQRARLQQSPTSSHKTSENSMYHVLERVFKPQLDSIISLIDTSNVTDKNINKALSTALKLQEQILMLCKESERHDATIEQKKELQYPDLPLTKRELEVLSLIKKGHTNSQIGQQLFIAERTVKFHVSAILSKLNAETRTEAVDIGLKRGLLSI
jgi:DNA-binding NarL/FixJ family response regulator